MESNNAAVSYALQKIYYKTVKNLMEKNTSLKGILKQLKIVGLESEKANTNKVEQYINNHFKMEWDEEENIWKTASQMNMFTYDYEVDEEMPWDDVLLVLSENDTKSMLKDMKYILSNVKKITNDVDRIVGDIDTIVAAIKPKYNTEKNDEK
ncbi:hypothetical protein [Tepidibacter sp. Z1-5]|uniref:hypothetical protein n=1 Tax=Tepidibacter sp. Z1-5 TaxID=3134138 RepID=UPI0030C3AE67